MGKCYYEILDVSRTASSKEIKKSYRKLVVKFHPDINGDTLFFNDKIKEINQAYECLSDSKKRAIYDERFNTNTFKQRTTFTQTASRGQTNEIYEVKITLEEVYFGCQKKLDVLDRWGNDAYYVVEIPKGVDHNWTLEVKGNTRIPDFFIRIQILHHSFFQKQGNDLLCAITIPYITTLTGGEVTIPWLDGTKRMYYYDPKSILPGTPVTLQGFGMPIPGTKFNGDLYITFRVRGTVDWDTILRENMAYS